MSLPLPQSRFRALTMALLRRGRSFIGWKRGCARRRARSSLIWGLLFVALLHGALIYLLEMRPDVRDPLYHERSAQMRQHLTAIKDRGPLLVVMLGTSRTGNAFNARRMQEELSANQERPVVAFNLGIAGNGPVMQQINLRRLLDQGLKPDLVVLEVLPKYLRDVGTLPPEFSELDLTRISSQEMDLYAEYGAPRAAYRERWNQIYQNPWGTMRFQLWRRYRPQWVPSNLAVNWNTNCDAWGWRSVDIDPMPPKVYETSLTRAFHEHGQLFTGFRFGESALRALEDTLELCRTEGIPAIVIHLPEDSRFREWYPVETRQMLESTFARISGEHGAHWVDAKSWVPDGNFYDGHHILRRGADRFTERLGRDHVAPLLREKAKR